MTRPTEERIGLERNGWLKPDGTRVEVRGHARGELSAHNTLAKTHLGYQDRELDGAASQALRDGHIRYVRTPTSLNVQFHHGHPTAQDRAHDLIRKSKVGQVFIDVQDPDGEYHAGVTGGSAAREAHAQRSRYSGDKAGAIAFMAARRSGRKVTDVARSRQYQFGESANATGAALRGELELTTERPGVYKKTGGWNQKRGNCASIACRLADAHGFEVPEGFHTAWKGRFAAPAGPAVDPKERKRHEASLVLRGRPGELPAAWHVSFHHVRHGELNYGPHSAQLPIVQVIPLRRKGAAVTESLTGAYLSEPRRDSIQRQLVHFDIMHPEHGKIGTLSGGRTRVGGEYARQEMEPGVEYARVPRNVKRGGKTAFMITSVGVDPEAVARIHGIEGFDPHNPYKTPEAHRRIRELTPHVLGHAAVRELGRQLRKKMRVTMVSGNERISGIRKKVGKRPYQHVEPLPFREADERIMDKLMEGFVKAAAIRLDGVVHVGRTHAEIVDRLLAAGHQVPAETEDGFISHAGRFLTRAQAMTLAKTSDQLKHNARSVGDRAVLASEDIPWQDRRYTGRRDRRLKPPLPGASD